MKPGSSYEQYYRGLRVPEKSIAIDPYAILRTYQRRIEDSETPDMYHPILSAEQISALIVQTPEEFSQNDQELITALNNYLNADIPTVSTKNPELRNQTARAIRHYYETLGDQLPEEIDPNSNIAALRRSALILFKTARIPEQQVMEGASKRVIGPLGVEDHQMDVGDITGGDILSWDGNLTHPIQTSDREITQLVRIIPKVEPRDYPGPHTMIAKEKAKFAYYMEKDRRFLENLHSHNLKTRIIPEIVSNDTLYRSDNGDGPKKRDSSIYMEYTPALVDEVTDSSEKFTAIVDRTYQVITGLKELKNTAGIVNMDIKPGNFGLRKDGSIVLFDWDGAFEVDPHTKEFNNSEKYRYSAINIPPELEVSPEINFDRMLTYQSAVFMLLALFGTRRVNNTLNDGFCYRWDKSNIVSPSKETLYTLCEKNPNVYVNEELLELLSRALETETYDRPSSEEFIDTLLLMDVSNATPFEKLV